MSGNGTFGAVDVSLTARADGSLLLSSREPLGSYAASTGEVLERWAREAPERTFLAERDPRGGWRQITYAEMLDACRRTASALLASGLDRTTPIAILSGPSISHAIVSLAAQYVGIPVAPISPPYSTAFGDLGRLHQVLAALDPTLVFADDAETYRQALESLEPRISILVDRGEVSSRPFHRLGDYRRAEIDPWVATRHAAVVPDDIAKILFTSGSTSEPKGVINTHRMLCSNQRAIAQAWTVLDQSEVVLVDWLPWHHTFGGNHNFNMVLFHGGTLYIDDGRPMPGQFARSIEALREHPPTIYFNVPRGHALLVEALRADEGFARRFFSRLRMIGNAAAALPTTTWNALRDLARRYGGGDIAVTGAWGLTETSPCLTAVHYPLENSADVGLPLPGTELLFVRGEQRLEVRVRGPQVMPGYWRRPDLTAKAFDAEGFLRTGDAMRFQDESDPSKGLLFDGRLAENFKLSSGTWVDAGAVRVAVLGVAGSLVDEVVVAGENRDALGLLLFVSARGASQFANDGAFRAELAAKLREYNGANPSSSYRVGRALLVRDTLSLSGGELTDKGSVNQRRVLDRRADAVARLFGAAVDNDVVVVDATASIAT
jgi:feruloyl-CoA synthase